MVGKQVELVSGAGDWPCLHAAVEAGCDSLYFGLKKFNLRANASNFDLLELKKIVAFLHKNKKKAYLALNTIIYNDELRELERYLKEAKRAGVDAVILWDMAVFRVAARVGLKIHLSTQASIANFLSLKEYAQAGARRVVLARECNLIQIKAIAKQIKKEKVPCSLEVFIHGAMCVSVSGRCLLSNFSFHKSANRGECLQVCRREFKISETQDNQDYILGQDYILSPKDLCVLGFIDQLILSGVEAFKIEGRRRSPEYVGQVTKVYRRAIDAFYQKKLDRAYKQELENQLKDVYNRGFSGGFYFGPPQDWQSHSLENRYQKIYLGEVVRFYKKISVAEIEVKNKSLVLGQELLFIGKSSGVNFSKVNQIQINNQFIDFVPAGKKCGVKLNFAVKPADKVFIWAKRKEV